MIIHFTVEERKQLDELHDKYEKLIAEKEAEIDRLRDPADEPEEPDIVVPKAPDFPGAKASKKALAEYEKALNDYKAKVEAHNEEFDRVFNEWLSRGSEEWRQARDEYFNLQDEFSRERQKLLAEIERKHFAQLGGDRDMIVENARSQATELISNRYNYYKKIAETGLSDMGEPLTGFSARDLRVDGAEIWLDTQQIIDDIKACLRLHYEALRDDQEGRDMIDQVIKEVVSKSKYVSSKKGKVGEMLNFENEISVRATRPTTFITPIDKISNKAFEGAFANGEETGVAVISRAKSRKTIYTMVSIDISELENVQISGRRELTAFDREVHDAIITLFVEGGNTYITTNMIYQTMTGKQNAHCSSKQAEAISDSITKLMFSHVKIDASAEAKLDKRVTRAKYDSNAINAKRVTISMNGQTVEAIKILDTPILFDYAQQKNQIGRFDVKLLDTPNNKNEETIILEGYLRRRILAIKGSSKLSPTILYETVYKQLDLSKIKSDSAMRNKTQKIRDSVKKALDYFKKEGFIKGYVENSHRGDKNRKVSVTIRY